MNPLLDLVSAADNLSIVIVLAIILPAALPADLFAAEFRECDVPAART